MRSSSRRPWLSNRQSSTFCALVENSAKLVPCPSQLAPSGWGAPAESRALAVRDEKNGGKRRNATADLGNAPFVQRSTSPRVPHAAAPVVAAIAFHPPPPLA